MFILAFMLKAGFIQWQYVGEVYMPLIGIAIVFIMLDRIYSGICSLVMAQLGLVYQYMAWSNSGNTLEQTEMVNTLIILVGLVVGIIYDLHILNRKSNS